MFATKKINLLLIAFLFLLYGDLLAQDEPKIIEAESGVLGADYTTATVTASGVTATVIRHTTDVVSGAFPGNDNRVATYTVTFSKPGTYQLFVRIRVGTGGANDDSFFLW